MNAQPKGFEADDGLRSDFIRKMTLSQLEHFDLGPRLTPRHESEAIPRTLVQYWNDPLDVPPDVRNCLESWESLRDEGFSIQLFGDASARDFIAAHYGEREVAAFERCRHPAMRSDYFRMSFVHTEGGLYVDADDVLLGDGWREVFRDANLKVQPLCYDIPSGGMVSGDQIRKPTLSTDDRIFYVNNNPLAAPARHPVLRNALLNATDKLLGDDPSPEIQSTTGPGNLTASLAAHANDLLAKSSFPDYSLLLDWESTAETRWDLGYRRDARSWRNMDGQPSGIGTIDDESS